MWTSLSHGTLYTSIYWAPRQNFYWPKPIIFEVSYTVSQYRMTWDLIAVRQEVSSVVVQELELTINLALYGLLWSLGNQYIVGKGTSRQRSGKGAIRKRFPLQKPRWEKTKLTIRYLYHETIVSRMGSYFPNRWPLSYLNLTKNMKTYIRRQQHKKFLNTKT